ncbi:peptidase inhibitor family I36 protein [Actinoplanes sp. NBC_00393]|uniref:peptidase inhibitor family I36 protein n=1 Tax=Actinoplanes sp. NBC_00393 TaxID=2975953 RepID=UPI002E241CA3
MNTRRNSIRKRVAALGVAIVAATAGTAAVASPAQAAPTGCPFGSFCVYKHINYDYYGGIYTAYGQDANWGNNTFQDGSRVRRNDSSWFNNGAEGPGIPSYVQVFGGGSMTICLRAGTGFPRKPASSDRGEKHYWAYNCE